MGKGGNAPAPASAMPKGLDPERQYTQIRGQVYDITDFGKSHPGGAQLLSLAVGRDATILFESHHLRPEVVQKALRTLPKVETDVNLCPDEEFPKPLDSALYKRIQDRIRKEIVDPLEKKGRMPAGRGGCQLDAAAVLAFFAVSLAAYVYSPSVLTGCALGFAAYWSGTGLQHTANHGGLTKSGWWNQAWGWFGSDVLIGKSSIEWRYHHMVSHHSYCNDAEKDQDVYTSFPLIRMDETQEWSWFHKYQAFYSPLLWPWLYVAAQIGDFTNVFINKASPGVEYLGLASTEIALYALGKMLHLGLTLALPAYIHGLSKVLLPFALYGGFGSFVLCWFFIVSHNLDGLRPSQLKESTRKDWGAWQIETSATWGDAFWSFMSGGLNYQIEHHLFPGTAHNLYPAMAPIIKEECKKAGLPYNGFEGFFGLLPISVKMFSYLHKMGAEPKGTKAH